MDWKSLITELQESGLSQKQIAEACQCSQPTICDLANGRAKDTKTAIGMKLLDLHRCRVGSTALDTRPKAAA